MSSVSDIIPKMRVRHWSILFLLLANVFFSMTCDKATEPDVTPPEVRITFPLSGSTVFEIVTVTAMATDNRSVEKLNLWIDGYPIEGSEDLEEPYEFHWNTSSVEDNSTHIVTVRASDTSENQTDSEPITLIVNNSGSMPTRPVLHPILYDEDHRFVIAWSPILDADFYCYTLSESMSEAMESEQVVFTSEVVSDTMFIVENVADDEIRYYRLTVTDTVGLESSSFVQAGDSHDQTPPFAALIHPQHGETVSEIVQVELNATDNRALQEVRLLVNGEENPNYIDGAAPYTVSWNTAECVNLGQYQLSVKAVDTSGNETLTPSITVRVDNTMFYPTGVELHPVEFDNGAFIISWRLNQDDDFASYTLFESVLPDLSDETMIFSSNSCMDTVFTVAGVEENEQRFYRLAVTDLIGLMTSTSLVATAPIYALDFDGINDQVVVPDTDGPLDFLSTRFTFESWVFPRRIAHVDNPRIFSRSDDTGGDRIAMIIQDEDSRVNLNINGNYCQSDAVMMNTWMHLAGTFDGIQMKIYINGLLKATTNVTTTIDVTISNLYIGHSVPTAASTGAFDGMIDEVRIWNVARTQAEIQSAMNTLLDGDEAGLIAYWRMDEGEGQTVIDLTGNHHGRLGVSDLVDQNDPIWTPTDFPH